MENTDVTFHYPPELLNLLIDTIPLLNKTKPDVFNFFKGSGVPESIISEPYSRWRTDPNSISKFHITRYILSELNLRGEACLRMRREVLKRVVEFENFSCCWPQEQLKAKGLVSEVRTIVNVKDSFTRMSNEREKEKHSQKLQYEKEAERIANKNLQLDTIKNDLFSLFHSDNSQKRGIRLEGILNSLFKTYGILIRNSFSLSGENKEGTVEQVDGVIEHKGHLYFVEMKWWEKHIGVPEISQHLVRIYQRAETRAIIISASGFGEPAIALSKQALQQKVVILFDLSEIVFLLENKNNLCEVIDKKTQAAIIDKNPFHIIR